MLVRVGTKFSRETVRRYRKTPLSPALPIKPEKPKTSPPAVRAKEPNHVWITDITDIPALFKIWIFKLVVVLDVYSRFPIAFRIFAKEPTSAEIASLVEEAAARFGKPNHFVTDRGSQFTATAFAQTLARLGACLRHGAIGQTGSIAIIERFWRTLKEMLDLKFMPPLTLRHLERKIELGLFYYATLRPHQGLNGATPAEIYFGLIPATARAVTPPRGRSPDHVAFLHLPFRVGHLDRQAGLPILIPTALA